jgi:hypothetical protein
MAISHAGVLPAARTRRSSLLYWFAGGAVAVAVLVAVALALRPQSEADRARADGEAYGAAVAALRSAQSPDDARIALEDVHAAAADTRDHAGDALGAQLAAQEDALARAVDGFLGARGAEDEFGADVYNARLDVALDDLDEQAADFRAQGDDVERAFADGYADGLNEA